MKCVVLVALLTGCWRSSPPPVQPAVEPASTPTPLRASAPTPMTENEKVFEAMERFADRFCDCRDAQCAQDVSTDMTQWSQELVTRGGEPPRMTDEEVQRASKLGERMAQCMQNAMTGSPQTP